MSTHTAAHADDSDDEQRSSSAHEQQRSTDDRTSAHRTRSNTRRDSVPTVPMGQPYPTVDAHTTHHDVDTVLYDPRPFAAPHATTRPQA